MSMLGLSFPFRDHGYQSKSPFSAISTHSFPTLKRVLPCLCLRFVSFFVLSIYHYYSTFSGACVHVRTLLIVRLRIVAMILDSMCSIWSSRSMSSFRYRRSRVRSQTHQIKTMKMVTGMVITKYIHTVGAMLNPAVVMVVVIMAGC